MRFTVKSTTTLILASKSPRRIELMTLAGFDFLSVPAVKEEKITGGTSPSDAVLMLSRQKAEEIAEKFPYNTVIGADTVVALGDDEIRQYIASGEPMDKAGAYGIQEKGAMFVKRINGDFYNVVGLPVARLARELNALTENNLQ